MDKLLGRVAPSSEEPLASDEPVIVVPIPPLVALLHKFETDKGLPLTESEVLELRDNAVCMTMTVSHRDQLAEKRGYRDVDPENVWPGWLAIRATLSDGAN